MLGIHFSGHGEITLDEVTKPIAEGKNVVVKVTASGICGTDRHALLEEGQSTIPGHEIAGEIVEVDKPTWAKVGDRVAINCHITCGYCEHCLRGDMFFCDQLESPGFEWDGGFAEHLLIPEDSCHPLPEDISSETGALMVDVLGTAFRGIKRANLMPGDRIGIWGAGPIGLEAVAIATFLGARVALFEINEYRLRLAEKLFNPDLLINPLDEKAEAMIRTWTHGRGLEACFECVGQEKAALQALRMLKKRGTLCLIGVSHKLVLDPWEMIQNETSIFASRNYNKLEFNEMISMIRNGLPADKVVTHRFPISEARNAFDVFLSQACGKVMFVTDETS